MDPSVPGPPTSPQPDLSGWKEIAAYLGKSVRAVQRWEQELGLPVRRLKTAAGQVVFAKREELDAWKARQEVARNGEDVATPGVERPRDATRVTTRWRVWAAVCGLLVVSMLAWIAVGRSSAGSRNLTFRFTGSVLEAVDSSGHVAWQHDFGPGVHSLDDDHSRPSLIEKVFQADLDGDGVSEVLAVAGVGTMRDRQSDRIYCFDRNGGLLWMYDTARTMRFRGRTFGPPYVVKDVIVSADGARQRLFASISHGVWWASEVIELDRRGKARSLFVQSGGVYSLLAIKTTRGARLLAGGVNNEYASGSIAMLDPNRAARSPQPAGSAFECVDCPTELPEMYLLLPPTDIGPPLHMPYNQVLVMENDGSRIMAVSTEGTGIGQEVLYTFDSDLRNLTSSPSDGFWLAHTKLENERELQHPANRCPYLGVRDARVMTADGRWTTERITPVIQRPGQPLGR